MKRRKRVKRKVKIAAVIVLLICIAVSLIIINRTRIQLAFKGYDRDERNIIMTLSAQDSMSMYPLRQTLIYRNGTG